MDDRPSIFPRLSRDELPDDLKPIWDGSVERRGEAKFIAGMAQSPGLLRWYMEDFYAKVFNDGCAPKRLKELGRLRLSGVHGCKSCNMGNRLDAKDAGLSDAQIGHIHDAESGHYNGTERAVIELADLMSMGAEPKSQLSGDLYARLNTDLSDAQILELAMVFSMLAGVARFIFAFDFAEKEAHCRF